MEGQPTRSMQRQLPVERALPAPTGQFIVARSSKPAGPAPTQVLTLPPLRGRNHRARAARTVVVALAVIGLVLGAVSFVGEPPALARSSEQGDLGSEAASPPPPIADPAIADPAIADPAIADPAIADPAIADPALADPVVDEPARDEDLGELLEDVAVGIEAEQPGDVLGEVAVGIEAAEIGPEPAAGGSVTRTVPGVVHLTFDDGPHPEQTPAVLDVLARHDARATFFVLGSLAEAHPQLIERIVAEGHTVANHSWRHEDLAEMNQQQFNESVGRTQAVLGEHATACLRPPFGSMNANTRAWAAELGLDVVIWHTDTLDWQKPGVDAIADTIVRGASTGPTILLHDGGGDRTQSIRALDQALTELSGQGLRYEPICS